ncbi:LysR family transcriptional regulator [Pigmentiphaga aceris]|uniref:LysR family transcriptional regulator n=1 Tax=Pigmentiphaga aceris TaxID=1940612 RepID=A0A5C0B8T5_9BURK|nr:LysR family transcriptional regulator [Pigmentiphaga aceris]
MSATLDIDLLRTFHAVARLNQFRAAADHVNRSPAAVSMHIQRLEAVAGGRLLERDNQSVSLTPLGQRLLAGTAELLRTHDKVLSELHGSSLTGHVKLGMSDEYAENVIRHILPLFTERWPNVVLEITIAASLALRDQIARGRLHLALAIQPTGKRPDPHALATTTPVWVGSATRGLSTPNSLPVSVDEPLPLAMHVADCPYREVMLNTLAQSGRAWRVVLSSPSSQAVETCVEAGMAISMVDRSRVSPLMRVLEDLPAAPPHEVVLLRAPDAHTDPITDLLSAAIRQHFSP